MKNMVTKDAGETEVINLQQNGAATIQTSAGC